jgi:hypothetical protein
MRNKVLRLVFIMILLLIAVLLTSAQASKKEIWKDEEFVKRVEAIKKRGWDKIETRDVAMLQFYEMSRLAEKVESRLISQADRFYELALIGAVALGAYLILQLLLMLILVVRVGRLVERQTYPGRYP